MRNPFARKVIQPVAPVEPSKGTKEPAAIGGYGSRFDTDPLRGFIRAYAGPADNPNPVLFYQRGKAGTGYAGSAIDLLTEEYDKDPAIMGKLMTRVDHVLQMDAAIRQADSSEMALRASRLIDEVGVRLGGWHQIQEEMLTRGIAFGVSVHEIKWEYVEFPLDTGSKSGDSNTRPRVKRWLMPTGFQQVRQNRLGYDAHCRLMLNCKFADGAEAAQLGYTAVEGTTDWYYPNPFCVLQYSRYRDSDNPYGFPLLAVLFYKAWLKRQMDILWTQYNDRYTTPTYNTEVDVDAALGEEDIAALKLIVANVQRHTGINLPPGVKLMMHELTGASSLNTFREMIAYCDEQASILIAGQTSTSTVTKQGSQAQAEVQERTALAKYASDARSLENSMNRLFEQVVTFNMPEARFKLPRLNINTKSAAETFKWMEIIEKAVGLGGKVPAREMNRITGLDEAWPGEPTLEAAEPAGAFGKPPSQQASSKTPARRGQRERRQAPKSQNQPRPTQ